MSLLKKIYPDKTPMPKSQSKEGNVCERRISIFAPFQKMYPDKYFHLKKFQCLKLNTLFSLKGTKYIRKKTINICHHLKMYPDKSVHAKKVQCLKLNSFSIKGTKYMWKKTNIFCHFKKKNYYDKTPMPKSQSKEGNVCERRIKIFASFQKMYPDKYFHVKKFQCLKLKTLFSLKGTKCIRKKTINFCHLLKSGSEQVFRWQTVSVF